MSKIGFIGLGRMGEAMAARLVKAGHGLSVWNRTASKADPLAKIGAEVVTDKSAMAHCATVFTMVSTTDDLKDILFGAGGVAEGLSKGKTVIDMSSISPIETKVFATRIGELGCDYVDAPVSGGEVGAKSASLTIMVGATQAAFDHVKPLFELMGKNITLVGGIGDGQTCKVCNQIIVALNIEAVSEALVFASKAGADPAKVRQALMGGFAASRILEVHGERMIKRTFDVLYRESEDSARVMAICLHPFISGVPHRIAGLDAAFRYICNHNDVWWATGEEIVNAYLASDAKL